MNPFVLISAILRRHRAITILFVLIVSLSVALGVGIISQERSLRQGSATAAEKFDLIVAAPGSQVDIVLSTVYLQPKAVELLEGELLAELLAEPQAAFVAPLAFGDNYQGLPVVGSSPEFVTYLADDQLSGRVFEAIDEAVIGVDVDLQIGETFTPTHDHVRAVNLDVEERSLAESARSHAEAITEVVGRLPRTGTPWDRSLVTPVEAVWAIHDLPTGHDPDGFRADQIGPPFDPEFLPGIPAVIVKPDSVAAAYGLRNQYRTERTMAFFPAEVLVQLYALMGDARAILSILALLTQVLVLLGIFAGILALVQLFRRQFVVLRAIGAPRLYLFSVLWGYTSALVVSGGVIGLGLGWGISVVLAHWLGARTGIALQAGLGGAELISASVFVITGCGLALIPAALLYRQPVVEGLTQL